MPEAALDNWQPVWNAEVSISTSVCVNFELRPGAGDIHICWFNFDALAQGNAYKPTKEPINYRGPGWDRTHDLQTEATPPAASCPARTLHATEIASKNATPPPPPHTYTHTRFCEISFPSFCRLEYILKKHKNVPAFAIISWHRDGTDKSLFVDIKERDQFILHNRYHGCWCHGDARGQATSNHVIDIVTRKYLFLASKGYTFMIVAMFNTV